MNRGRKNQMNNEADVQLLMWEPEQAQEFLEKA
jgi:hypothetical protein